jgi:hypothetical protein
MAEPITWQQWRELEAVLPAFGTLNAKRLPDAGVVLAVDHEGHRHLLIPLREYDEGMTDNRSRGVSVNTRGLEIESDTERPFLDVCCTDATGVDAFNLLADSLVERLSDGAPVAEAVRVTIDRWRRFWSALPLDGLSTDEVRGLFGELWFLLVWLLSHGVDVVQRWVGPMGARHDFQWVRASIECKATTSIRGHIHRINGLDQLDTPTDGTLSVFSLRIREEQSSANSLVTLVSSISEALTAAPEPLDLFENRLASTGYSAAHSARYAEIRFRVVDERLYRVDESFPRISSDSFVGGLPRGIERVEYEVNLDAVPGLQVIHRPDEFEPPPG